MERISNDEASAGAINKKPVLDVHRGELARLDSLFGTVQKSLKFEQTWGYEKGGSMKITCHMASDDIDYIIDCCLIEIQNMDPLIQSIEYLLYKSTEPAKEAIVLSRIQQWRECLKSIFTKKKEPVRDDFLEIPERLRAFTHPHYNATLTTLLTLLKCAKDIKNSEKSGNDSEGAPEVQ